MKYKHLLPTMKVLVTYPDDTTRETNVADLEKLMKEETKEWKTDFFKTLDSEFRAFGAFAKYTIVKD